MNLGYSSTPYFSCPFVSRLHSLLGQSKLCVFFGIPHSIHPSLSSWGVLLTVFVMNDNFYYSLCWWLFYYYSNHVGLSIVVDLLCLIFEAWFYSTIYIDLFSLQVLRIFNALHWMQGSLVARKVSVCPSVKRWIVTKGRKIYSDFYTARKIS